MRIISVSQTPCRPAHQNTGLNQNRNISKPDSFSFTGNDKYLSILKSDLITDYGKDFHNNADAMINEFLNPLDAKQTPDGFMYKIQVYTQPSTFKFKDLGIDENKLLNQITETGILDLSDSNATTLGKIKSVAVRVILRPNQTSLIEQAEKMGFKVKLRG